MKAVIRDATPEEIAHFGGEAVCAEGTETWGAIAEEAGEIKGHLFISRVLGQMFGHGTRYWGSDKNGALRLWLTARTRLRQFGETRVLIHIPAEDRSMEDFWIRRRFRPIMVIYAGDVGEDDARSR